MELLSQAKACCNNGKRGQKERIVKGLYSTTSFYEATEERSIFAQILPSLCEPGVPEAMVGDEVVDLCHAFA